MHLILISFLLGALGAFLISKFALSLGLVDLPNERSSHRIPTPRGGGIGISLAALLAAIFCHIPWAVVVSVTVLGIASFIDDRWGIEVKIRLIIQLCCAATVVIFLRQNEVSFFMLVSLGVFWIVFITGTANFYNFMDGINGISGITGITAFGFLALVTKILNYPGNEVLFNACIAASCLGFLPFNLFKAKVFMGDIGSIVLGFLFAVQVYRYSNSFMMFFLLICFLFLFYIDATTTLFIRWRDGEKLTQAHRRHLYQILSNQLKQSHWKVTLGYGIIQVAISSSIFLAFRFHLIVMALLFAMWLLAFLVVTFSIRKSGDSFPHS
jgi:Fuc2NAc and GlcNAc transferase